MDRHKVLFVSAVADFKGGAEKCLVQFMENPSIESALVVPGEGELSIFARKAGCDVYVVNFGKVNDIRRPFKLTTIFQAGIDAIKVAWQLRKIAQKSKANCVHSNGLKTHGILSLGCFFQQVPVICHIHDIPYTKKEMFFWRLLSLTSTRLLLVSEHCWGNGKLPKNVGIVPNGLTIASEELAQHTPTKELKIGFVGRIHPHKGLHLAIDWLTEARKSGFQFQFYIRGEAAESELAYLANIKKVIESNNLTDCCHFEGRIIEYSQVYANLDITLMPSLMAEPFGLVAIESFDNGIPCFAYPSGALPTIIQHSQSGFLCREPKDFVESLHALFYDDKTYDQIRKNAHKRLKNEYSITSLYNNLDKEYCKLIKQANQNL